MTKIKITQQQYDKILLHEQTSRLALLKEAKEEETLSHEDLDVVLTIGKLIGLKLTGKNLHDVETAIKKPEVLTKVKDTLENEEKLNTLIDNLVSKGMKDAKDVLIKHTDRLVDRYNKAAEEAGLQSKLDFIAKGNITELNGD